MNIATPPFSDDDIGGRYIIAINTSATTLRIDIAVQGTFKKALTQSAPLQTCTFDIIKLYNASAFPNYYTYTVANASLGTYS